MAFSLIKKTFRFVLQFCRSVLKAENHVPYHLLSFSCLICRQKTLSYTSCKKKIETRSIPLNSLYAGRKLFLIHPAKKIETRSIPLNSLYAGEKLFLIHPAKKNYERV